ncbi:hypothetical protein ES703_18450 [subsurface metagenome]
MKGGIRNREDVFIMSCRYAFPVTHLVFLSRYLRYDVDVVSVRIFREWEDGEMFRGGEGCFLHELVTQSSFIFSPHPWKLLARAFRDEEFLGVFMSSFYFLGFRAAVFELGGVQSIIIQRVQVPAVKHVRRRTFHHTHESPELRGIHPFASRIRLYEHVRIAAQCM